MADESEDFEKQISDAQPKMEYEGQSSKDDFLSISTHFYHVCKAKHKGFKVFIQYDDEDKHTVSPRVCSYYLHVQFGK